jgi:hypothetical protein
VPLTDQTVPVLRSPSPSHLIRQADRQARARPSQAAELGDGARDGLGPSRPVGVRPSTDGRGSPKNLSSDDQSDDSDHPLWQVVRVIFRFHEGGGAKVRPLCDAWPIP